MLFSMKLRHKKIWMKRLLHNQLLLNNQPHTIASILSEHPRKRKLPYLIRLRNPYVTMALPAHLSRFLSSTQSHAMATPPLIAEGDTTDSPSSAVSAAPCIAITADDTDEEVNESGMAAGE